MTKTRIKMSEIFRIGKMLILNDDSHWLLTVTLKLSGCIWWGPTISRNPSKHFKKPVCVPRGRASVQDLTVRLCQRSSPSPPLLPKPHPPPRCRRPGTPSAPWGPCSRGTGRGQGPVHNPSGRGNGLNHSARSWIPKKTTNLLGCKHQPWGRAEVGSEPTGPEKIQVGSGSMSVLRSTSTKELRN